ncbi:MAG TPA: cytosine permease [Steroidobacteraceae bacterium]|jgi:NCS1 family nucleobase:cation symporter-1
MANKEEITKLERSTIQPIGSDQRHGTARDLFTIWFGSNITLLTVVTGGLAVTVFGLPFVPAVLGLIVGNAVGAIFMALHAAQGPTLGVPQMVQTRGQFGSIGSLLVVGIVIVMYMGFLSSNLVLSGESLASLVPGLTETPGVALVGILSILGATYGYDLIHAYTRVMSYFVGAVMLLAFGWIIWVHHLPPDFLTRNTFSWAGFLGAVSVAALWQIAYAPYVSDYTRYMPQDTGVRPAFWSTYWGCTLGSLFPMTLGAMVGLAAPKGNLVTGLGTLTQGIAPLVLISFSLGIASANSMNLYCAALSALTFGQTLVPKWSPGSRARITISLMLFGVSVAGALLSKGSFLANYESFISILLYVLVPWTAINLVDYYLLRHGQYDIASFFRQDGGIYGRVNAAAVICYGVGILVQVPFISAAPLFTGFVAKSLDGTDLSWIAGLAVTSPAYYWLAKRSRAHAKGSLARYAPGDAQS